MKLFLASRINKTLDLIRPLLNDEPKHLSVAFIPTAADPHEDKPWILEERDKFISMGFSVTDFDLKNRNFENLISGLSNFDIIHVAGGNSFYLLNEMQKSGFGNALQVLLAQGKIYSGSSAGSLIMGPNLDYIQSVEHVEDVPELTDYTGLNFIEERLVPHSGRDKYRDRHDKIREHWGDKVTFLTDDQAVIVNGDKKYIVTN